MIILGIMNGTSGDGIDYVWANIEFKDKLSIKFVKHIHKPFPKAIHAAIKKAILNKATTYEIGELHHSLGKLYATQYKSLKIPKALQPKLIGLHGQTVYHRGRHATLQIGEPSYLSHAADASVIFNFRAADIAQGGEGAPLAPVFHRAVLQEQMDRPVAFHNLGGISNLTYCYKKHWLALDTGPASTMMDAWIQMKTKNRRLYDKNGELAAAGVPHDETLRRWLKHPYLKKTPPKSCGREEFNLDFIKARSPRAFFHLSLEDQLATLTEFSVMTIADAYKKYVPRAPEKIYFSGGGTKNRFLMERLKIYLGSQVVATAEDLGWPSEAIEGGAFALLAYLRVYEQALDLRSMTGGSKAALLGQMCE